MAHFKCMDDPKVLSRQRMCVHALSKDVRGRFKRSEPRDLSCGDQCQTVGIQYELDLRVGSHAPCDSPLAQILVGPMRVQPLVVVFDRHPRERGFHAADFFWTVPSVAQLDGHLSGVNNAGTHRQPAFDDCQECAAPGVMEGRLCGRVVEAGPMELRRCQIIADYRLQFDPRRPSGAVRGVIEGVLISLCR